MLLQCSAQLGERITQLVVYSFEYYYSRGYVVLLLPPRWYYCNTGNTFYNYTSMHITYSTTLKLPFVRTPSSSGANNVSIPLNLNRIHNVGIWSKDFTYYNTYDCTHAWQRFRKTPAIRSKSRDFASTYSNIPTQIYQACSPQVLCIHFFKFGFWNYIHRYTYNNNIIYT
jgi:hypothetical protein